VGLLRRCSRTACGRPATTTLTYVYADQTAVVGPLASYAEPHAYDLCDLHAQRLSAPRGWEVLRLAADVDTGPSSDDLLALADAVREAGQPRPESTSGARPGVRVAGPQAVPGSGGRPPVQTGRPSGVRSGGRTDRPTYDDPPGLIDRLDRPEDDPGERTDDGPAEGVRRGHLRSLRSAD
jgi:hypothetical protein